MSRLGSGATAYAEGTLDHAEINAKLDAVFVTIIGSTMESVSKVV